MANAIETTLKGLREDILHMAEHSPHVASSLSCIDILAALHIDVMALPQDSFVLSKGHGAIAYYAILAHVGLIEKDLLKTYGNNDSTLAEHPLSGQVNGLTFATALWVMA